MCVCEYRTTPGDAGGSADRRMLCMAAKGVERGKTKFAAGADAQIENTCMFANTDIQTHTQVYTHAYKLLHPLARPHTLSHTQTFSRNYHSYDIFIANKLSSSKAAMYICHISKRSTSHTHTLVSNHSSL